MNKISVKGRHLCVLHYRCLVGSMTNSRSISVFGDAQMLKRKTVRLVHDLDESDTECELVGSSCTDPPSNVHDTIGNRALYKACTIFCWLAVPFKEALPLMWEESPIIVRKNGLT